MTRLETALARMLGPITRELPGQLAHVDQENTPENLAETARDLAITPIGAALTALVEAADDFERRRAEFLSRPLATGTIQDTAIRAMQAAMDRLGETTRAFRAATEETP